MSPTSHLARRIMERAQELPEATPLGPATRETFADLGSAEEVEQALERLTEAEKLTRVFQGIYMRLIETHFGKCGPLTSEAVKELAQLWGETIVPCPGATANYLGLTTQNLVRRVYITSGPSWRLYFSRSMVELRHAPSWQLVAPERKAGAIIRALEWLGPQQEDVEDGLAAVLPILSKADQEELAAIASQHGTAMPPWLVKPLCDRFVAAGLE